AIDFCVLDTLDLQHTLRNDAESLTAVCADRTVLLKAQQNIRAVLFCRLGLCLGERSRCEQQSEEPSQNRMLSRIHILSPIVFFPISSFGLRLQSTITTLRHLGSLEDELMNFSLPDTIQEVLHVVRFSISQLWVQRYPFLEVLFRTEEVVDSSTTTQENPRCSRLKLLDAGVLE